MGVKTIAIDQELGQYKEALKRAGFKTIDIQKGQLVDADMAIISGIDENILGEQNIRSNFPVLDARGLSEQEVVEYARERLITGGTL